VEREVCGCGEGGVWRVVREVCGDVEREVCGECGEVCMESLEREVFGEEAL